MRIYIAVAVALVLFVGSTSAQARKKVRKRGFGSIVVVSSANSWKMAATVLQAVEKNPHGMTSRSILVERNNPREDIAFLRTLLMQIRKARRAIFRLRLKPAIRRLERVIAKIKPLLIRQGTSPGLLRRYMQAYNYLGAAYQLDANNVAAKAAFRIVLSIDPDRKLKSKYFTAEVVANFEKLKTSLHKGGTLRVNTDHPSLVIVDGRMRGVAPVVIQGLHPGEHIVELRRLGYLRITRLVTVDAQTGGTLRARVVKDLNKSALRLQLATVEKALRQSKMPVAAVAKLAAMLKVNQLILCRASLDDGEASLFNADTKSPALHRRRTSPPPCNVALEYSTSREALRPPGDPVKTATTALKATASPAGVCPTRRSTKNGGSGPLSASPWERWPAAPPLSVPCPNAPPS